MTNSSISAIIPTIGRANSLRALLESLAVQTRKVDEVIVADGSGGPAISQVTGDPKWSKAGLAVKHVEVQPPNAVQQRMAAINLARGDNLLLLDDDVVLEPVCVEQLLNLLESDDGIVAVCADFSNHAWPCPTRAWQFYLRYLVRMEPKAWQGRVVGPLLRFGYNPLPAVPAPMEWLGSGNSLVRRSAFLEAGGFSDFFLHRCTTNEDVDLGLKLRRLGRIMLCPAARMAHYHAPFGRVSTLMAAEDDLFNRFFIMRRTLGYSAARSYALVLIYFAIETTSNFLGCLRRLQFKGFLARLAGRLRALGRIVISVPLRLCGCFPVFHHRDTETQRMRRVAPKT